MYIVSKHLEKVLSDLKNVHFDHRFWIMCLELLVQKIIVKN